MSQSSHHSHDALDINNTDKKHHSKHKKHHHHKEAIEKELFDTSLASDNDYKYTNKRLREFTESHEEELTESSFVFYLLLIIYPIFYFLSDGF